MHVLFWKGPVGPIGSLIRAWEGRPYSHAELRFSDGKRFRINAGIHSQFYWSDEGHLWDSSNWDCLQVLGGNEAFTRQWCETEVGCGYDWAGILFAQILKWNWQSPRNWFCSELCVAALQAGGYPQVAGLNAWKYSPARLGKVLLERKAVFILP